MVEFASQEGHVLRGTFVGVDNPRSVVVAVHGFRRSSDEKKFSVLAEHLASARVNLFAFDLSGCGRSTGDFVQTTFDSMVRDLQQAVCWLQARWSVPLDVVAHSLGACVAVLHHDRASCFRKALFLAPALDQRSLLRYWFVRKADKEASWHSFLPMVDERAFAKTLTTPYMLEASGLDVSDHLCHSKLSVMHVHGEIDSVVPIESVRASSAQRIIVKGGDHHLEAPDMLSQWILPATKFLSAL